MHIQGECSKKKTKKKRRKIKVNVKGKERKKRKSAKRKQMREKREKKNIRIESKRRLSSIAHLVCFSWSFLVLMRIIVNIKQNCRFVSIHLAFYIHQLTPFHFHIYLPNEIFIYFINRGGNKNERIKMDIFISDDIIDFKR